MKSLIRLTGLLVLGLAFIVPSFGGEDKKAKDPEAGKPKAGRKVDDPDDEAKPKKGTKKAAAKKAEKKAEKKFAAQPNFMGKLTQMDPNSQRDFVVQVTVYVPNPGGWQHLANLQNNLMQHQMSFARATNLQGKQNAINAMQNTQFQIMQASQPKNLYNPKPVDIKLRATEDIKVRWGYPPPDYDEKGNLKKYTKEELKALKGDEGLPGYKGEYDALRQGQMVAVYLVNRTALKNLKTAAPKALKGKKGSPQKAKKITDEDDEEELRDRHEVNMIVILAEPKE